ncbi:MAG TPA: hypothetical protein VNZ86_07050, partial [Bacteroidia bacterium]|nr:hypothetical protein [Bacteroidia bacterium]
MRKIPYILGYGILLLTCWGSARAQTSTVTASPHSLAGMQTLAFHSSVFAPNSDSMVVKPSLSQSDNLHYKQMYEQGYTKAYVDSLIFQDNPHFKAPIGIPSLLTTGPEQNCGGGIPVCQSTYTQGTSYTGYGTIMECNGTCLLTGETNSVWYIFTVQPGGAGNLAFTITTAHDYDWALYDITSMGCAGVPTASPLRCNYSATYGNTGMSAAGVNPSEPASGIPWSTMYAASVGQTFALVVNNYSSDLNGYTINFATGGGYASIFDNIPPTMTALSNTCNTN